MHTQQQPQQRGQQFHQQGAESTGARLQDVETPQQREAIHGILRAIEVCEWCADQCVQHADPNMVECIRLCEDVSELGETAITLIPRQSRYVHAHLGTFLQAVEACARECGQHSHSHCQECSQVLQGTSESVQRFLSAGHQAGRSGQQVGQGSQQVSQGSQQVGGRGGYQ